jgi:hypothetical protein
VLLMFSTRVFVIELETWFYRVGIWKTFEMKKYSEFSKKNRVSKF